VKAWRALVAAALLAGVPIAGSAQPAPSDQMLVLRQGTAVPMRTIEPLRSKGAYQGQRFALEVSEDVRVDGLVVIPKGARGAGEVSRIVVRGVMGKPAKLEVRVLFVETGGARIRLDGKAKDRGASGAAPVVLAAPLIGVSAAIFTGKGASIPAGAAIDGYVHDDLPLMRPPAAQ
jgi:hypothetical protein